MKKQFLLKGILTTLILSLTFVSYSQVLKFNPKASSLTVNGTSNLHDWKTETRQMSGELVLVNQSQIKSLTLKTLVKSMKSGEKIMDTKTYETFNADKNPEISFKMTNVSEFARTGDNIKVTLNGTLTMGGVSKTVAIKANGKELKSGSLTFSGSVNLKMSDYKMAAPTAMMGMLKVGDGVRLDFNVQMDEQPQAAN